MFLSGYCGIISELSLFNLGTLLMGGTNTTLLYTMGVMIFFMGVGSLMTETPLFRKIHFDQFAWIEMLLSLGCMVSIPLIHILAGLYPELTLTLFISVSAGIGLLIGTEIPVILRLNQGLGLQLTQNSARVMMADYFGSLVAFICFPFLLFPKVGIAFSAYSGGLINLVLALLTVIFFREKLQSRNWVYFGLLTTVAFAIGLGLSLDSLTKMADKKLYRDPIIHQQNTAYQTLVFTEGDSTPAPPPHKATRGKLIYGSSTSRFSLRSLDDKSQGDLRFFINGGLQFSTLDEYRYHETLVHPAMFLAPESTTALVLGGGDGLAVRELLKYPQLESIFVVDLDQELTDLFRFSELARLNNFAFQNERVHILNEDAFMFLRNNPHRFPLLILDFPDPYHLQSAKLYSRQFFWLASQALSKEGILVVQSTSPLHNRKVFLCIKRTLESAGFSTLSLHVPMRSFENWGFHLASQSLSEKQLRSRLRKFDLRVKTRFLDRDTIGGLLSFGKDIFHGFESIPVNDLDHLVIVDLYKKKWHPNL